MSGNWAGAGVDGARVLGDLRDLARIGAYKTGVHRPSLTREHVASLSWLTDRLPAAGLRPVTDGIGRAHV